jgi:hypothetical protein
VGLPVEGADRWDVYRPLLADPALKPAKADIEFASAVFREFLQIRKSSALFRLRTAEQIQRALTFLNTGPEQIPGLIVMRLSNVDGLDETYNDIVVLFNARPDAVNFADASLVDMDYSLHPIQQGSVDELVRQATFASATGAFSVSGRTTAVFVIERSAPATATVTPAVTVTPAPEPQFTQPLTLLLVLGGLLLAVLAGLFFWRRSARR